MMKIKSNDIVKVLCGKDRGKTGKVLQVLPKLQRASVDGLNLLVKNIKSRKRGEKGQKISFPSPIHLSNLALMCPKCGQATRVEFKLLENRKKVRVCKKCKEMVDK